MRGDPLRRTKALPGVTKRTAGKGTTKPYTKTSTKADKSGHRTNKGAKTNEGTQSWQGLGQSQTIDPGNGRQRADKERKASEQREDKEKTRSGHMVDTEGNMADTRFGGAAKADTRRAGTKRIHGGHMADKLWERGQSISQPALFFLRENPTVNCLGKKILFYLRKLKLDRPKQYPGHLLASNRQFHVWKRTKYPVFGDVTTHQNIQRFSKATAFLLLVSRTCRNQTRSQRSSNWSNETVCVNQLLFGLNVGFHISNLAFEVTNDCKDAQHVPSFVRMDEHVDTFDKDWSPTGKANDIGLSKAPGENKVISS